MAKKKRWKKRRSVDRTERVAATAETLAKLKPWTMQVLLQRGPEAGGIDSQQFEAAVEIAEAYRSITAMVGFKPLDLGRIGVGNGSPGARGERTRRLYVTWGNELIRRFAVRPHVIVEVIEDERPIDLAESVSLLCSALSLWSSVVSDDDRATRSRRQKLTEAAACG